ncbi:hypothetical protein BB560_001853 [Smittium megazygosporum]|uniref:Glutathione peroxidase n=1 Tax=Smittium megazygosporum TaxID=133381 RepID=A0A2T9ZGE5_9FUNG|nr:hypothetical protein BB560_001853 [Smittium megazygosporum]
MSSASKFYSFIVKDSAGADFNFSSLKGKVVLIVNVASKCGFTPQYKDLESLHQEYKDKGLEILGFPCNQFGSQEPGTEEEIVSFCSTKYNVSFPIMAKSDVNGDKENPVYAFLKSEKHGLLGLKRIKWNFEKFLVDRNGKVVGRYASTTNPSSLKKEIEALLDSKASNL